MTYRTKRSETLVVEFGRFWTLSKRRVEDLCLQEEILQWMNAAWRVAPNLPGCWFVSIRTSRTNSISNSTLLHVQLHMSAWICSYIVMRQETSDLKVWYQCICYFLLLSMFRGIWRNIPHSALWVVGKLFRSTTIGPWIVSSFCK